MFLWFLSLLWRVGDHLCAGLATVLAVLLGAWQFLKTRHQTGMAVMRATFGHVALCCAFIVTVFNLRLDVWMANSRGVSVAEIHQLYPLWLVPLLSVSVVLWIALLVGWSGRRQPAPAV
jgi:cytochrome bd-type quinol oxidase subunit 2